MTTTGFFSAFSRATCTGRSAHLLSSAVTSAKSSHRRVAVPPASSRKQPRQGDANIEGDVAGFPAYSAASCRCTTRVSKVSRSHGNAVPKGVVESHVLPKDQAIPVSTGIMRVENTVIVYLRFKNIWSRVLQKIMFYGP
jgi:hypothetical protein